MKARTPTLAPRTGRGASDPAALRADDPRRSQVAGDSREAALAEVVASLGERPPRLPSKYFYDARGAELFERITRVPEYYPTRTELAILDAHADEIAARLGTGVVLVEYGSGAGRKTRRLLDVLDRPAAYVPVDVSHEQLEATALALGDEFPTVVVVPVCADFTRPFALPGAVGRAARRVAWFPGSTIGNFTHDEARGLLAEMRELVGARGAAVIGTDLRKPRRSVEAAYDDAAGVTRDFNLNLLRHLNRELGTDFDDRAWRHAAPWCEAEGRIEMRLYAERPQRVHVGGRAFDFAAGNYLLTEYSHKYRLEEFAALAADAGWRTRRVWTDAADHFAVHLLES